VAGKRYELRVRLSRRRVRLKIEILRQERVVRFILLKVCGIRSVAAWAVLENV
jgi:hypothetical protein